MLNNTDTILSLMPAIRATVALVLGHSHPDIEDVTNDVVVSMLDGGLEGHSGAASLKSFVTISARNAALNWRARHCNSRRGASVNMTDFDKGEGEGEGGGRSGDDDLGVSIDDLGDGAAQMERVLDLARLEVAIEVLEADAATFVRALLDGATCKEAGALVGWSAPTATRRRVEIFDHLRARLA
jgi:DNA-directed RNA polymerase specialized sigma24 family protein